MLAVAFILFVAIAGNLDAVEINCESIDRYDRFEKCCFLNGSMTISDNNVTISGLENRDVNAILFSHNKKIQLLPVEVYKKFPSVEVYLAINASIKEISALNFARLSNLKLLDLQKNLIELIPDDCFQGLTKLYKINFDGNRIKTVNGIAFSNLPRLVKIGLSGNACINKFFNVEGGSNKFRRKISRSCASADVFKKPLSCIHSVACDELRMKWRRDASSCCELEYGTQIDAPDYTFLVDMKYFAVEFFVITNQKNVEFLPISVHEKFPILQLYRIENTAIPKISKKNFEKLYQLKWLTLDRNQIEVIRSDTFEDLVNLKTIYITNQRLASLNSQAFANLLQLDVIGLFYNYCINAAFHGDFKDSNSTDLITINNSCGFDEFESVAIACERFDDRFDFEICNMTGKTAINATNFVIADLRDEGVGGILFDWNKKIEYLPYKIYMQFRNIASYRAGHCSIKQITKENFEKLESLKEIFLWSNKIQKISGNTFKGLKSLTEVYLNDNQIKSINGRTFDQLPLLYSVVLTENDCIDERLKIGESIKNFTRKIIQQCAFTETGEREFEKVFDIECGVGLQGSGFIVGGNETKRGEWPFMASLIYEPINQFFCGGNVITASHILTAAHCIQTKNKEKPFEASQIAILFGRHDISLRAEVGSETRGVKEIKVHPRWNPREQKFGGDIAVLEMDRPVQFSELIQPVCLTVEPDVSQLEAGYVVGWGKSEAAAYHENIPRQVLISSVTTDVCFDKDYELGSLFAEGMFCAGGDGFGPCHGDSGGGFFVKYHGLWTLRGVVSSGKEKEHGGCDVDRFTLFTNAVDYSTWISDVTKKNVTSKVLISKVQQEQSVFSLKYK